MNTLVLLLALAAGLGIVSHADAHGTPIRVDVVDAKLTVSGGVLDEIGFAPQVFADPLVDTAFIPWPGDLLLTDAPGVEVNEMEPDSGLFLRPLARPVLGTSPTEMRLLWYWNPVTELVELAPHDPSLRVLSTRQFGEFSLHQADAPPPPELLIAEPSAGDLGTHQHVLYYLLDDDPDAAIGAYGFFAQMTSPAYLPSDPFLIALNHGLDSEAFQTGALAINAAANESPELAGDYNGNGRVEQGDLDLVLLHWGEDAAMPPEGWIADLPAGRIDQQELDGALLHWGSLAVPGHTVSGVPEPASVTILLVALASAVIASQRRRWRANPLAMH